MKQIFQKNIKQLLMLGMLPLYFTTSCKKFVDVPQPINQVTTPAVFSDDKTATAAVLGIYSNIMNTNEYFLNGNFSLFSGLSADEFTGTSPNPDADVYSANAVPVDDRTVSLNFWTRAYAYIYQSNACIEGLNKSAGLTPSVKQQLLGESKFMRALCYFYLVNTFGDVPLLTETNYKDNASAPRTAAASIYKQLEMDLTDAQSLLSASYPDGTPTRPNKWAAAALLARVYLYEKKWAEAYSSSNDVINSGGYSLETDLNLVFLGGSKEAILQFVPEASFFNSSEGNSFIPQFAFLNPKYTLTPFLLNAFEAGDARKDKWLKVKVAGSTTITYPFKYKLGLQFSNPPKTEYNMVLRLAEQYLIRAEAQANGAGNSATGAIADLNIIRSRASLPPLSPGLSQSQVMTAVMQERRIELFAEWGHRWFDLKRTDLAVTVLAAEKGSFKATSVLYPIPLTELQLNPFLKQNPGY